jgi:hypothetical protein
MPFSCRERAACEGAEIGTISREAVGCNGVFGQQSLR